MMMSCLKKFNAFQNLIKLSGKQNNTSIQFLASSPRWQTNDIHPPLLPPNIPLKWLKTDGGEKQNSIETPKNLPLQARNVSLIEIKSPRKHCLTHQKQAVERKVCGLELRIE